MSLNENVASNRPKTETAMGGSGEVSVSYRYFLKNFNTGT